MADGGRVDMARRDLPSLESLTEDDLENVLAALRAQEREPRGPLLQLEAVTVRLRRRGLVDRRSTRAAMLHELLRELAWGGLSASRGQSNGHTPPIDADDLKALTADFAAIHRKRRPWSALWYRYLSDHAPQVEELARIAGVARETYWRNQKKGLPLLLQAITAVEIEARQGLADPSLPAGPSPDDGQREEAEAILQRVREALAAGRGDALDLPESERRLILGRSWDSLDLYRLRQALLWSDERYRLDERFVDLSLLIDLGEDAPGERWQQKEQRYGSLEAALLDRPDPALVLLGAPGSGKSTMLRHHELGLALDGLRGETERIGLFVPLSRYGSRDDDGALLPPLTWLAAEWEADHPDLPPLTTLLNTQRVILLLDAVNEMPHRDTASYLERVSQWQRFVADLARRMPGNRVVFSCRSLDYSAPLSGKDVAVPQLRVEPLSDEKVKAFLHAYCPAQADRVWASLEGQAELDLLRTPFLLRMLALQAERQRQVPTGRAALFSSFLRGALRSEVQGGNPRFDGLPLLSRGDKRRILSQEHWTAPFHLPGSGLFPPLADLAFAMQDQRESNEQAEILVPYDKALDLLEEDLPVEHAEAVLLGGCDLGILDQDRSRDDLHFRHQLLQEYFAARKLARQPRAELAASEWRAAAIRPSVEEEIAKLPPAEPLPRLPSTGWEETMLLAAAMTRDQDAFVASLAEHNLPLAGRCAAQPESKVSEEVRDRLRWALVDRSREPAADLRARIAAGEALGELGDPRFKRCVSAEGVEYLLPPMVKVEGGRYWIGSDEGSYPDVLPRQQVDIETFWIGQFPVTNAEYARFIAAGGYEDPRWWVGEAAQRWWRGEGTGEANRERERRWRERFTADPGLLDQLLQTNQAIRSVYNTWKDRMRLSNADFELDLLLREPDGRYHAPSGWGKPHLSGPLQPVVGVSWHEVEAYANWLSSCMMQEVNPCTELHWEVAATGAVPESSIEGLLLSGRDSRQYRPMIVGMFSAEDSGFAVGDLLGNIYEWTAAARSLSEDRRAFVSRVGSADSAGAIAVRGGWCYSGQSGAGEQCLHTRSKDRTANRVNDRGFRLVATYDCDCMPHKYVRFHP